MNQGNTRLVEYGIQNEKSDIRVHVGVVTRRAYVYDTDSGQAAVATGKYREANAYTGRIITGVGCLVPPREIEGCKVIPIPSALLERICFDEKDSTTTKGQKAVEAVKHMLEIGSIPIALTVDEIADKGMQIDGLDIAVGSKVKIQVKCDWKCGPRAWGGTGNLFLQVAECNPLGMH